MATPVQRTDFRPNHGVAKVLSPRRGAALAFVLTASLGLGACEPKVQVAAPDKPIVINLNVKIEHEVRVKLEKDVDELLQKNSDLF